jgi:hypothetical protein
MNYVGWLTLPTGDRLTTEADQKMELEISSPPRDSHKLGTAGNVPVAGMSAHGTGGSEHDLEADKTKFPTFGVPIPRAGGVEIPCLAGGTVDDCIDAFVNGIRIGRSAPTGNLTPGQSIVVPCNIFPCVPLPCEIRFAIRGSNDDMAPPLELRSVADVHRLVGHGRLEETRITISNGVLKGFAVNRINGLGRPLLVGRVNGSLLREVRTGEPRAREEGGSSISFTMSLDPADFEENGVLYEILELPDMILAGSLSYRKASNQAIEAGIQKLQTDLERAKRRLDFELARASEIAEKRYGEQRQLLDRVVEYLIALVFDRFPSGSSTAKAVEADDATKEFRQLVAQALHEAGPADLLDYAMVKPADVLMADGWGWPEQDSKGFEFRWMGLEGTVFNPHPGRTVKVIEVSIGATYDGHAPTIAAMLDSETAGVNMVSSPGGAPHTLRISPKHSEQGKPVHVLRLISATAGRPIEGQENGDERILSAAVLGVTFYYRD